ncbi:MAG: histidinol-phosphatase [Clostridia bacterium]|nr:histidinol-phosphatase [Clostridia bacterium]
MKTNFHTHTSRCKHASGTDEQYVKAALLAGFDVLGFADHAAWAFASDYVSHCRMNPDQWPEYRQSIQNLRSKYAGQIRLRLGMETEYYPRYMDQLLRWRDEGCEYFILASHFLISEEEEDYTGNTCRKDDEVRRYADQTAKAISTGLYCYLAHPDLYLMYRPELNKACMDAADVICQAAREAHMPIEYNLLGLGDELRGHSRGYPNRDFWQYIRRWNNDVIIGVDAHDPAALTNQVVRQEAERRLKELNITPVTDWIK